MKWILTSLAAGGLFPTANAAIPTFQAATAFYRSSQSQFSSGQAARALLEKNLVRNEFELAYRVKWDHRLFTMKAHQVLKDIQCASRVLTKENTRLLADKRSDARSLMELPPKIEAELKETREAWARVVVRGRDGWIPLSRLEAKIQDHGAYIALIDTFLRHKPAYTGRVQTTVPRGSRLMVKSFDGAWARVQWGPLEGYLDLQHLVGRADFAVWAYHRTRGWLGVSHRTGAVLKILGGADASLSDIIAFSPNKHKGIVNQTESSRLPPLRAHVELKKTEATLWGVSKLTEHGDVWWKKESLVVDDAPDEKTVITTEQLLKREIFSYSVSGTTRLEGLVSAGGIYRTVDGQKWEKIHQFGNQDLPVSVHPQGSWFVGAYRSENKGRDFEPFIRWDVLTRLIEARLQRPPRYVKIQKVEALPGSQVQIAVDTGVRRLVLKSKLQGQAWR